MDPTWNWIAFILLLVGTVGTLLPLLPGLPLMLLVIVGYGWAEGFTRISPWVIILALILTILGVALDYLMGPYAAKKTGASQAGVWGALLGGLVGFLTFGFVGLLVGPFFGALAGELLWGKSLAQASKTGMASLVGVVVGNVIKFSFALVISAIFFFRVFL